jgi:hypothetical protein
MNRNRWSRRPVGLVAIAILAASAFQVGYAGPVSAATGSASATELRASTSAAPVSGWAAPGSAAQTFAALLPNSAAPLPALPQGWPSTKLELGLTDSPGGAAALHASGTYRFRYQYLAGGVNTGSGWATWNSPPGKFADYYVQESVAAGITPVFIYYQLLQSNPAGGDEGTADRSNLKNTSTMAAYWADVTLLFTHLGAYSSKIVVDIEPDLWGYIQQASTGDNGASVAAAVASSGNVDLAGMPNNAAGFAQAFVLLRNKYAPNVLLGYELSMWGTNTDPLYQNIPLNQIDPLAARSTAFQQSLGASFDLVFTDPADRDAAFKQIIYGDGGASWWDATDYQRFDQYVGDFVRGVGLRMVLWQIPLGNTKMRAVNNTWGHYQDNHVEWWFDDSSATHLTTTVDAGVVAMLFGGGAAGTTSAADAMSDGVTNPAAIDGNNLSSYSADDDGGYFRHQANAYYAGGALALPETPVVHSTYVPVAPTRFVDTRIGNGLAGKLPAGAPRTFQVAGRGGVPTTATAVTGNVTVVNATKGWAVFLGPNPVPSPSTSTVNFSSGEVTGNGLTVALSSTGSLSATYMSNPGNTTDLVFDVTGYFVPDMTGATYHPMTPARLLDTRSGTGLAGKLAANTPQTFQLTGRGGIPSNATAVTGNVTVVNETNSWAIFLGPEPAPAPGTSTLNFNRGDVKGNSLTVAVSSAGTLSATYMAGSGNTTDLVFDVTGYYTPDSTGATFVPIAPIRLLDTRVGNGLIGRIGAGSPASFNVAGRGVIPGTASAVTGNVTVVNETSSWAVFLGPNPTASPSTSTINFSKGDVKGNGLTVALAGSGAGPGTLSATYMSTPGNTTDLVFDVTGYFGP